MVEAFRRRFGLWRRLGDSVLGFLAFNRFIGSLESFECAVKEAMGLGVLFLEDS